MKAESRPPVGKIRVGISQCLLGEKVRYDGGHKLDTLITETLGRFFEWAPVCPEVEIGLGVPRESLRLVGEADRPRMVGVKSGADHTDEMILWARGRLEGLSAMELCGYILKKDSPSCGMERVRVYSPGGMAARHGRGIFAAQLMSRFPLLPVEEEGRLHDMVLRENFVERVYAFHRWNEFLKEKPRAGDFVRFHTRHKLTLSSHSETIYRRLGRLAAEAGNRRMRDLAPEYGEMFMAALAVKATAKKHANVLFHLLGYLKQNLDADDRAEIVDRIEDYRAGLVPLIVPMTLLLHHFRKHPIPWVMEQTYLNPYPAELMLRNHV